MSETENSISWEMVLQQQLVNVPEYMKQNEETEKEKKEFTKEETLSRLVVVGGGKIK